MAFAAVAKEILMWYYMTAFFTWFFFGCVIHSVFSLAPPNIVLLQAIMIYGIANGSWDPL